MIKLIHAADLHLDSPFSALTPEQAALRRQEQRELLGELANLCNDRGCDLLLLAGDLFDGVHVYRDTVEALCQALRSCHCRVLIAPGNHDWLRPGSPYLTADWPENVHIFTKQQIESVYFPDLRCRVYGAGFAQEHCPSLLEGFRAEQDGSFHLMVIHGDAGGGEDYNPVTKDQIAGSGLNYLALGHVHKGGSLQEGGTLCAWPGCAMGRGFDECGEKGVLFVTLEPDRTSAEFIPLGARRYELLELNAGEDPLRSVEAALHRDTSRDIYRIVLTGESQGIDTDALQAALRERFFALELIDRTVPPLALWEAAGEDSLKGQFLARLKERYEQAPEEQRQTVLLAARYGLSIFEEREVPPL